MNILAIALAPSFAIMLYIYNKDKEKEPKQLLARLFFYGIIITIPASYLENVFLSFIENENSLIIIIIKSFIIIALIEEGLKYYILRRFVWNNKEFDQFFDGIVYGVFVSLGFATFENIFYIYSYGAVTGILRAFTAVPGHAIFGITMGYYMVLSRFSNNPVTKRKYANLSLLIPLILHGFYNFILLSQIPLLNIIFIPFVIYLYIDGNKKAVRMRKFDD